MDMKCEEEFKVELVENTEEEDDKNIDIHLEQLLTFEEIQSDSVCLYERNWYESIDMKSEIEVKEESFDIEEEEEAANGSIHMKKSFDIEEEETSNDKLFTQNLWIGSKSGTNKKF
ncbi:hypothetical protein Avbf_17500 [Armadillidium vulgare]|nr:hypothetical protein Avbf_17500 [Armadillidium vulgare]